MKWTATMEVAGSGDRDLASRGSHGSGTVEKNDPRPRMAPRNSCELGMTLLELVATLAIIAILSTIALGLIKDRIEKARLAQCMANLRSIQSTVWTLSDGTVWPEAASFWDVAWAGKKPGPYYYFANSSDANKGHGNDWDFCDEENPGKSSANRDCKDIRFVVLCQHDHGTLANYLYIEDEGSPKIAGWSNATNPGYDRLLGAGGGKGKK